MSARTGAARRPGRHCLLDALENPNNRAAYDQRQQARVKKAKQDHRELMQTLACVDCGDVPKEESAWVYGGRQWTRRPGGRCRPRHQGREQRSAREAEEQLEAACAANAALCPCWTCRGPMCGKAGSKLELWEKAGPDRLGFPQCAGDRAAKNLGPLVLPARPSGSRRPPWSSPRTIRGGRRECRTPGFTR
ncbi:hypothetical protein [Kitasatospora kifunensis]|uniref:Uncharacterized protein n=1 Tax=Kitasatospora kifunensis TaxID=58351 RepID=A0A7W7RAD9_KITKI|nr:hypothetical protein [Kitasatospora kifunensis]MBB4928338.1 hypothetical protein [Kitasatospora kifunensis]